MNIGDELKGIAALVTGASRGIGRATAFALARHGARLLVHFNNPLDQAREVVMGIRAEGGDAEAGRGELSTHAGSVDLAQTVRTLADGKLDILLTKAGISKAGSLEAHSEADLDRLLATNVKSPLFLFTQLLPTLTSSASVISERARWITGACVPVDGGTRL